MDSPTKSINKSTEGSKEERQESTRFRSSALATPSPTSNYRPLASEQPTPRKQRPAALNCKARIYKCIKRLLKRNNFPNEQQKAHHQQQQQVQGKSKVDYKEIKSLLEKEKSSLEYDVNLAKCMDKPALVSSQLTSNFANKLTNQHIHFFLSHPTDQENRLEFTEISGRRRLLASYRPRASLGDAVGAERSRAGVRIPATVR